MRKTLWIFLALPLVLAAGLLIFIGLNWRTLPSASSRAPSAPLAVVVPHHDFAKTYRAEFWRTLRQKTQIDFSDITRVVVIGPDHFGLAQAGVTYATGDFSLSRGAYRNFFQRPSDFGATYRANDLLVKNDHAVGALLDELKQNFPNSSLAALLIGQNTPFAQLAPLIQYLTANCRAGCLVVASVDFTHYQPRAVIAQQDAATIAQLRTKTVSEQMLSDNRAAVRADSPQSLYVLQEFARANNLDWWLQNQTNSAADDTTTDTTSHVYGGYLPRH